MSILQQRASDVRLREIDLSHMVTSASSSNGAIVFVSNKGKLGLTHHTSADSMQAEYYSLSNPVMPLDVASAQNFFTEANSLWGARAIGTDYAYSALALVNDGADTLLVPVPGGITDPEDIDFDGIAGPNQEVLAVFYPNHGPGSYGDKLAVSIESNNIVAPSGLAVVSENEGGQLTAGTYDYIISSLTLDSDGVRRETVASAPAQVIVAGSESTYANLVSWDVDPRALGTRVYGRAAGGALGLIAELGRGEGTFLDTGAILPDTTQLPITNPADAPAPDLTFTVNIFDTEVRANQSVESFVCSLVPYTDADGIATEIEEKINPFSEYMQVVNNVPALPTVPEVRSVARTFLTGGDSGTPPTSFDISRTWDLFGDRETVAVNLLMNSGQSFPNVQQKMDVIARRREDAVALLDVPSAQQQYMQAINYRNLELNLNSSYSALFCPDVEQEDTINGRLHWVPFSGWAGALCARTDRVANASFSPAGLNRGLVNVLKARHRYDDGQASELFRAQVNYTRTFIGQGIALWEQKTLQAKDSALSWLSVRRIVNVMKMSLYDYGLYIIHEPNDEFLRRELVQSFTDYLQVIQDARGIKGFTVVADASNNPAAFENGGILRATVIIQPNIPVHELQVDIAISKQGVSFSETLNNLYGAG